MNLYQSWLASLSHVGNAAKRKMMIHGLSAENIYGMSRQELSALSFLKKKQIDQILRQHDLTLAERLLEKLKTEGALAVTIEDEEYPHLLLQIRDAPYALYYYGTLPKPSMRLGALVGARRCTPYGANCAYEISRDLSARGFGVVSGLASGIDAASHRGALDAGKATYAFLACGPDICYPKENLPIYQRILTQGAVLSEFPPGIPPKPQYFPSRNRLISGACEFVIVAEAKERSGSLITADFALEQGGDVWAVPGRITDPLSAGTNRLIAQGAFPFLSRETFFADLSDFPGSGKPSPSAALLAEEDDGMIIKREPSLFLEKEEMLVYSCFDFYPKSIQQVQSETGEELFSLLSIIMRLCNLGLIRETFTNQYIRLR